MKYMVRVIYANMQEHKASGMDGSHNDREHIRRYECWCTTLYKLVVVVGWLS